VARHRHDRGAVIVTKLYHASGTPTWLVSAWADWFYFTAKCDGVRLQGHCDSLLEFEHELVHRSSARRLDREVTRILRMAPKTPLGDQPEASRFDFAAQRILFDTVKRLTD
jgi:hypothetical protein